MSFLKKTWLARIGVGLNRFRMNNSTDVVLESNPISVTQQGDQLSADNMNNLETRIDNAFTEMAGNLATIEVSPSQHNWTVGSQIVYNGILYKVTSAISTDDALVVGTNISPYPVSSAISDISATLLWTNPSPTSSFPAQTISFENTVNYKFFIIVLRRSNFNENYPVHWLAEVGSSAMMFGMFGGNVFTRAINSSTYNSISFSSGNLMSTYGSLDATENYGIPLKIYGIK